MDDARTDGRPVTRRRMLAVGLAVLSVAAIALGAWVLVRGPQYPPASDTATRQDVRAATERFATAINTYDVTDLDPYVEKVKPMLTEDLAEQFEVSTQDLLAQFAETEIVATGKVEQVAVDSVDADSAVALAAITVTTEPDNIEFGQPRLRWRVELVREGDEWLIDNFANVTVDREPQSAPQGGEDE